MRKSREYYRAARSTPDGWLRAHLNQVRRRCAKNGIPFDVSSDDIETPAICPILQKKILYSGGLGLHAMAPSIDRLVPSMGYVKGNCRIISMRANTMKNDCIDPLVFERLADYVRPIN